MILSGFLQADAKKLLKPLSRWMLSVESGSAQTQGFLLASGGGRLRRELQLASRQVHAPAEPIGFTSGEAAVAKARP
jgi:hypothetical protein